MTSTASANRTAQTSWKEWFLSRESAAIINKSNQEKLFSTFNSTISNFLCPPQWTKGSADRGNF